MTSADPGPDAASRPPAAAGPSPMDDGADVGLLSPMRAAAEATGDRAVLRAMLDAEAALTRAQAALGLVPPEAAEAVTTACDAAFDSAFHRTSGRSLERAFDLASLAARSRAGGNPVIPLVEDLREAAGPHGRYVHMGATSQDILDTALMLVTRRARERTLADLHQVIARLTTLAAAHRDTVMAARTLTQQAVPTTFGLKAAGWRKLAMDAHHRLAAVTLPAQLGGPAGTLDTFAAPTEPRAEDRIGPREPDPATPPECGLDLPARFAAELGLAAPVLPWHVLRTPVADLAGALAFTAGAMGKLAADVLVLSRTEIGEVSEGVGGGSSSMPHKHNPARATMIAAAARQVPALATILYGSLAAEDERPPGAWHAEWQPLRESLRLVAGAVRDAAELLADLRVHPDRMRANLRLRGTPGAASALVDRALKNEP